MGNDALTEIMTAVAVTATFVLAFVEFVKQQGVPSKYLPLVNVAAGVVIVLGANASGIIDLPWAQQLFAGVVSGLTAGGFYSGQKAVRSS